MRSIILVKNSAVAGKIYQRIKRLPALFQVHSGKKAYT
jgi:hypothetical protein